MVLPLSTIMTTIVHHSRYALAAHLPFLGLTHCPLSRSNIDCITSQLRAHGSFMDLFWYRRELTGVRYPPTDSCQTPSMLC